MARGSYHWVFALSDRGLSTPRVYAECDRLRTGARVAEPVIPPALMEALLAGDAPGWVRSSSTICSLPRFPCDLSWTCCWRSVGMPVHWGGSVGVRADLCVPGGRR